MEVVFGNEKIVLAGNAIELGQTAPNFTVMNNDLQMVSLDQFEEDFLVISVVPSIDTGVCDYQTKTFNQNLARFKKVKVLTISNDLPFAQKRWCGASGLKNVVTLSDYLNLDFAKQYGTLIPTLRLQARAVFILDQERKVIFKEIVKNVSDHPSYEEVESVLSELTK